MKKSLFPATRKHGIKSSAEHYAYTNRNFSAPRQLKRSVRNLYGLDFFEDVKVDTTKGSADDKMVLKIDVTEKSTGAFSFGAGYGNMEKLYGVVSIAERNLFGRGQHA